MRLAITAPVRSSSIILASSEAFVSKAAGLLSIAATVGGETQEGGPNVSAYPGRTLDI